MENTIIDKIDAFIRQNEQNIIEDIALLVAQRSVEEAPALNAPFGPGPRAALDVALGIARRLGLATQDGDGYVGWAEVPGQETGYLATITHVDIVPEGEGWDGDPLVLRQREGWLLGRGVADDKGPSILCLYLAKFFQESQIPLRYGLRILLGTNEETGMQDVEYYLAHNPQPLFCFSPDTTFPVCNGEKGVYGGDLISAPLRGNLVDFCGGVAGNVIPSKASCVFQGDPSAFARSERVQVAAAGDGLVRLEAEGIGGHAAHPEGTINAIGLLVDYLLAHGACSEEENTFLRLLQQLHQNTDASGLGLACQDEVFTPLTCIGGVISFEDGILRQNLNIRYPMATTGEEITARLAALAAQAGATYVPERDAKPFYISADNPAIDTLLRAYNGVTGKQSQPYTMGGGTYARHFANAVAFGPAEEEPALPVFAGPEHGANEGAYLPNLLRALKIYILAMAGLQEVEF